MIDWSKPIQTKQGTPANLVCRCTNSESHPFVVSYVDAMSGEMEYVQVDEHGILPRCTLLSMVENVPVPTKKVWRNLYRHKDGHLFFGNFSSESKDHMAAMISESSKFVSTCEVNETEQGPYAA